MQNIYNNFLSKGIEKEINDISENHELNSHIKLVRLTELIDFKTKKFDKEINLNIEQNIKFESKYPIINLGTVCKDIIIGGTPSRKRRDYYSNGKHLWLSIKEMNNQVIMDTKEKINDLGVQNSNVKLIPKGTLLFSFKLTIGKTAIAGKDLYTNEAIAGLILNDEKIRRDFLNILINAKYIPLKVSSKVFGNTLNSDTIPLIKIPDVPLKIQDKIIKEISELENYINLEEVKDANTNTVSVKELQSKMKEIPAKKQAILDKYLK